MSPRAISIRQLWAFLIVMGAKDVENRSWKLPEKYIGKTILVHAGKEYDSPFKLKHERFTLARDTVANLVGIKQAMLLPPDHPSLNTGGIVGAIRFEGCVLDSPSPWAVPGQYHWQIEKAWALPFWPCKGRLHFFPVEYPHDITEQTEESECPAYI